MNLLDQLITAIDPRAGLRRQAARLQLGQMRRYDAAASGRRVDSWSTRGTSADAASSPGLARMRDRSRDLVRNNPYAAKAVQVLVSNVIGTGIMAKAKNRRANGRRRSQAASDVFREWANDPRQCDYDGRLDFAGIQALAFRCLVESGEVLIRQRTPQPGSGQRVPLQLQVLEPDVIDSSHDGPDDNGGWTTNGIVYDAEGRRTHYWLYNYHPGDTGWNGQVFNPVSNRIPADQVIHVYRRDRPHQNRGVPWLAPVTIGLRDFDDYMDAQLLKQKVSACMTGVIVDVDGAGDQKADVGDRIEPGAMVRLGPGQDVRFSSPPSVGEIDKIQRGYLLRIAAGIGITYEALTGDLSATNFSSARLGWLEFQRNIEAWRWQMLVPQMLQPIWEWFSTRASLGGISLDGVTADWVPPRRELIDPSNETRAKILKIRAGMMSPQEGLREDGYEPDEVLQEIAEFMQMVDDLKLVLDIDPRKVSAAGLTQARPVGTAYPPTGEPPENPLPAPEPGAQGG